MSGSGEPSGKRLDRSLARLRNTFRTLGERTQALDERHAVVPPRGWATTATVAQFDPFAIAPVRSSDGEATATAAHVDRNATEAPHHSGLLRQMFARFFGRWLPWQR